MKFSILTFWLFYSVALWSQTGNQKAALSDEEKIVYLITKVGQLENAQFIRNGIYYTAYDAANHLRMKREKAGNAIKTVDDFIEKVASKSSLTGQPYLIEYSDGKKIPVNDFYLKCLKELEASNNQH